MTKFAQGNTNLADQRNRKKIIPGCRKFQVKIQKWLV